jgi:hypothetical protein
MTVRFTTDLRRASLARRLFCAAGLLLILGGVVFVPLCSVLSFCTMSCCHHGSSPAASAASQSSCCTISRSDAGNGGLAISSAAAPQAMADVPGTGAVFTFAPTPNAPVSEVAARLPHPLDCPRHILNSAFLI